MIWIYLLNETFVVPRMIELFNNELKFFLHLIRIYMDNIMKYMKADVSSFCANNGIIHQAFCSHKSQQNSVAERKTYILDVARSVMIHMHVSSYLWSCPLM